LENVLMSVFPSFYSLPSWFMLRGLKGVTKSRLGQVGGAPTVMYGIAGF
jgi:hypothetical protein